MDPGAKWATLKAVATTPLVPGEIAPIPLMEEEEVPAPAQGPEPESPKAPADITRKPVAMDIKRTRPIEEMGRSTGYVSLKVSFVYF